jgi:hypothetical protein
LGSSPTIMSVLKNIPGPSSRAQVGMSGSQPNRHASYLSSPDHLAQDDEEDDDGFMFGPLSLGDEESFLGTDQLSYMSLR